MHRFDPGGTAGSEQRQVFALFEACQQFFCFFQHGQVSSGTGVIDLRKAQVAQTGNQAAHHVFAAAFAKFLTQGDAHGRGDLGDHPGAGFVEHPVDLILVAAHGDRSSRADSCTLATAGAAAFGQWFFKCGGDSQLSPAMHEIEHAAALLLGADADTVATEDAFPRITHQRRTAGVDGAFLADLGETDIADPVAQRQFLELAAPAFAAGRAQSRQ